MGPPHLLATTQVFILVYMGTKNYIMYACNSSLISVIITLGTCKYINKNTLIEQSVDASRLTVVSREAKKKQHACASSGPRDHYSELFTWMAALKF